MTYSACRRFHFDFNPNPTAMSTQETAAPYTLEDLLIGLQALTPAQRTAPVEFWGEGQRGKVTGLFVAEEDYINPSGEGAEPASQYRPKAGEPFNEAEHLTEQEISLERCLPAGAVMLEVA